jgi:hypothetical protein
MNAQLDSNMELEPNKNIEMSTVFIIGISGTCRGVARQTDEDGSRKSLQILRLKNPLGRPKCVAKC